MRHAFAPGHVSGFFAIHDQAEDVAARGSRGGGWSLRLGAYASVQTQPGRGTTITLNGTPADAPVTRDALQQLAPDAALDVTITLQLPTGQGFGMSAAGTLAACLAAASELDLDAEAALAATHAAEVTHGAGLGDAVGSWFGSGELRMKPGCPPAGWAMRIDAPDDANFLFCVMGEGLPTSSVIRDDSWRLTTRRHGDPAVDRVLDAGRPEAWRRLLVESAVFSHKLGLMPPAMQDLGAQLPDGITWGQCMLGSTMWVSGDVGDLERAEALLEGHGTVLRCGVDEKGARLVRHVPEA